MANAALTALPLLLLALLLPGPAGAVVFDGSDFKGLQPPLQAPGAAPVPGCTTYWYSQRLDHFSRHDQRRWQQRYTLCTAYWNPQAKHQGVYMYLGNESPLPGAWPTIFSDMARDEGGLLLYAEHRYYGESMPLGNRSLTNEGLVYLTVEQVLADYAELVTAVRKLNNVPRSAPTICYGGSYGGNLAAYLRLQYPRQFDAALASSAVVKFLMPAIPFLKTKYDSYKVMTNALLDAAGKECGSRVNRAYATMQAWPHGQWLQSPPASMHACRSSGEGHFTLHSGEGRSRFTAMPQPAWPSDNSRCLASAQLQGGLAYSAEGRQKLAAALHMCQPAALDSSEAVNAVGSVIRDVWWGTFQTMYRANPKFNAAAAMCKIVNAAPATDLGAVEGVAQAVIAAEFEDDKCIPSEAAIFPFGSEDNGPNATDDPIMRAWMYQCCRQGFTVSTHLWSAYPSIYGYWAMPVQFFKDWCTRVYGVKNPLQYPRQFTYTPHKLFAGTSNLIFSNGEYDPWAAGSVFTAQAPRVPAIMTPKASHRQDLSAAQAGNTAAFNATQSQIKAWIREWVLTPKHHWE